ncbi:MAG: bifunctional phosphoribosylaminoimidazolecarboxamide formyltransferase/IMP cyclohydrolase [Phycisphaerales bacterium]
MTSNFPAIRRALISVSDKTDLVPFARALAARGVRIVSTGGTAKALTAAGVEVQPVETLTHFPEGLDGRVKTLHPGVHGGILAMRDNPEHSAFLRRHGIEPIDLVCINLYPFQETVARPEVSMAEAIENIDVGGPAMLRAAAKNHQWVTVVPAARFYDRVIQEMDANAGATTPATRAELAAAAFARTSEYDAAITCFLSRHTPAAFPQTLQLGYLKIDDLRYGENPHQTAALYRDPSSTGQTVVNARQLHGKQLSYNNINDAAAALEAVKALTRLGEDAPATYGAVVVKHTNPCGGALAHSLAESVSLAIAGDPRAAYGGILAMTHPVDDSAAAVIGDPSNFFEVVVAPDFEPAALELLRSRWSNVRLLAVGEKAASTARKLEYRSVPGGMLVQERDTQTPTPSRWQHRAGPLPTTQQLRAAAVLDVLCRHVSSNAVVVGGPDARRGVRLFGVGSGQVDRVSACRLAVEKAGPLARGAIAVGDAFFPFSDGPRVLIDAGVSMIVHPGGSRRDDETFSLCDSHNITCMTTGLRHFRH